MKAMVKCNEAGANVVSMSLGGNQYSQGYADTLETILKDNDKILFVAAAGKMNKRIIVTSHSTMMPWTLRHLEQESYPPYQTRVMGG